MQNEGGASSPTLVPWTIYIHDGFRANQLIPKVRIWGPEDELAVNKQTKQARAEAEDQHIPS